MSYNDPISDTLTRIRNGLRAKHAYTNVNSSKQIKNVLEVLKLEGYIIDFTEELQGNLPIIKVFLKYSKSGHPVIKEINRISTPGRRQYCSLAYLLKNKFRNGLGIRILTTSKGIMTDLDACKSKVGGEIICSVF